MLIAIILKWIRKRISKNQIMIYHLSKAVVSV